MIADDRRGTRILPVKASVRFPRRRLWLLPLVGALHLATAHATEVPPKERIPTAVARTLAGPADQPLNMPTDVAVDRAGRAYVADGVNDRIVRFNPNGDWEAAVREVAGRQLSRPVGLYVDVQDRLWIADTGNGRVVMIDSTGNAEAISPPAVQFGGGVDMTDIALSPDGEKLLIVDNDRHRLLVRDAQHNWTTHGAFGRSIGQLEWPFMIAASASGEPYVSESVGGRVQRLSAALEWTGSMGRWGVEPGQLYRPKGVAVDARDRLFVSDSTLGVVQVFDRRGGFVGVLTDVAGGVRRFEHPMGVCFDSGGKLYVVELKAGRVAVIEFSDAPSQ